MTDWHIYGINRYIDIKIYGKGLNKKRQRGRICSDTSERLHDTIIQVVTKFWVNHLKMQARRVVSPGTRVLE